MVALNINSFASLENINKFADLKVVNNDSHLTKQSPLQKLGQHCGDLFRNMTQAGRAEIASRNEILFNKLHDLVKNEPSLKNLQKEQHQTINNLFKGVVTQSQKLVQKDLIKNYMSWDSVKSRTPAAQKNIKVALETFAKQQLAEGISIGKFEPKLTALVRLLSQESSQTLGAFYTIQMAHGLNTNIKPQLINIREDVLHPNFNNKFNLNNTLKDCPHLTAFVSTILSSPEVLYTQIDNVTKPLNLPSLSLAGLQEHSTHNVNVYIKGSMVNIEYTSNTAISLKPENNQEGRTLVAKEASFTIQINERRPHVKNPLDGPLIPPYSIKYAEISTSPHE